MSTEAKQLNGFLAESLPKIGFGVGILALLGAGGLYFKDAHHFFFSYLFAFMFFLSLSLGSLFFVLIQFITRAGWSVLVRRVAEHLMKNIMLMALLFIPLIFGVHELYHWSHDSAVAHDHLLQVKAPYLNVTFFIMRAVIFFALWSWLAQVYFKGSTDQDGNGDKTITLKLQKYATFGIILYALTETFAAVDWMMSLTPHWYSTIYGVYFFAASLVGALSVISIILLILRRAGFLQDLVTVEHYHDLGKLLFGFNIFWSYIAFSQFFLIWYANIPEETSWFLSRWEGSWKGVSMLLLFGHFFVPFILLMSRHAKRNLGIYSVLAAWMIFMHMVDIYWLVMPSGTPSGFHPSLTDMLCFVGIGGIYCAVLFSRMKKHSLIPHNDPRVHESINFENA